MPLLIDMTCVFWDPDSMLHIREAELLICLPLESEVSLGARESSLDLRAESVWEAVSVTRLRKLGPHSSQEAVPQHS